MGNGRPVSNWSTKTWRVDFSTFALMWTNGIGTVLISCMSHVHEKQQKGEVVGHWDSGIRFCFVRTVDSITKKTLFMAERDTTSATSREERPMHESANDLAASPIDGTIPFMLQSQGFTHRLTQPCYLKTANCQALCRETCQKYDAPTTPQAKESDALFCDQICKRYLLSCASLTRTTKYPKSY